MHNPNYGLLEQSLIVTFESQGRPNKMAIKIEYLKARVRAFIEHPFRIVGALVVAQSNKGVFYYYLNLLEGCTQPEWNDCISIDWWNTTC